MLQGCDLNSRYTRDMKNSMEAMMLMKPYDLKLQLS